MTQPDHSRVVGLIGYPLRHSISPAFQQAAFDDAGLALRYELWETPPERVAGLAERLRRDATLGANVTIPYKQVVLSFLDQIDPSASAVGAVNTIVHRDERLAGYNTDVVGFIEALRRDGGMTLAGRRVAVVGAGGAARAVVAAALREGAASITVSARRIERAEALIESFRHADRVAGTSISAVGFEGEPAPPNDAMSDADLVVNATPLGTSHRENPDELPVDPRALRAGQLVFDLVYNPPETPLLRAAREQGARTLNGLPMLVYQGAAAFELWTGRSAPTDLMRRVAREALGV